MNPNPETGDFVAAFRDACTRRWGAVVSAVDDGTRGGCRIDCPPAMLVSLCGWLHTEMGFDLATLVVEDAGAGGWRLHYCFHTESGRVELCLAQPIEMTRVPSISAVVHAADWHEREIEDLFGLDFEGHPKLGEFVLHEHWPEGVNPLRADFAAGARNASTAPATEWTPPTIVDAPGAFVMPVGPVYSDFGEAAHFQLETVGEDVIVTYPRLFYKHRGVEKIAEGKTLADALLLAERFSGTSAFAHALALCQAAERIAGVAPPPRALALRALLAEFERLRHHAATITGLCASTALAVAASQAGLIEEALLRASAVATGHRYLFGVARPGGLACDVEPAAVADLARAAQTALADLDSLDAILRYTSSFLDRLEAVGIISPDQARAFGLVGPVARASGLTRDLRESLPYGAYDRVGFFVPVEQEGDGYARLRVLLAECRQSAAIIRALASRIPDGPVATPWTPSAGTALGWTEAPIGAAFHWLRLDAEGRVVRYRLTPPSFNNWHGFHLAAENFAFQDFPIILASVGLSVAECDR